MAMCMSDQSQQTARYIQHSAGCVPGWPWVAFPPLHTDADACMLPRSPEPRPPRLCISRSDDVQQCCKVPHLRQNLATRP